MFPVKKARSRKNKVDYVEIDLNQVRDYLLSNKASQIKTQNNYEYHSHSFPLSEKATFIIRKKLTKGKKILKGIVIEFHHGTWQAGIRYDENLEMVGGFNYDRFEVSYGWDKSDKNLLYIALDGGFDYSQNRHPYFLHDYEFNYVFERID